jgi:hypothetical protein
MKKGLLVSLILAVTVFMVGTASTASAYAGTPMNSANADYGFGGRGGRMGGAGLQDGVMHDAMLEVFSEKLGISVEDLEARLDAGETMSQIALSEGLTLEQFEELMDEARDAAFDQAVTDGLFTQAQADAMKTNGHSKSSGSYGMRGSGNNPGYYTGTGTCINQ